VCPEPLGKFWLDVGDGDNIKAFCKVPPRSLNVGENVVSPSGIEWYKNRKDHHRQRSKDLEKDEQIPAEEEGVQAAFLQKLFV
jgi:hypothetical protein